jgi:hypothetical protein
MTKSKLEFTGNKLEQTMLELANLNGYKNPSTYLDELLGQVKEFNSNELVCEFYLDVHYLCKKNAEKFWCESHRKDISEWLKKASSITSVFNNTWQNLPPQQIETKSEQEAENDFTLSTIEDWLFEFKEKMSEHDYSKLVLALKQYFDTGAFPAFDKPIKVGRVNVKLFGWHLNKINEAVTGGKLTKEYLLFAKQNISLFANVQFDENDVLKSNLYKYFTTKTK